MGSIFGPFVSIEEKPFAWEEHSSDILSYAMDNLATDLQHRLRARLDSGVDLRAAIKARTVKVRNDMGELIIKSEDSEDSGENVTVSDLFTVSKVNPTIEGNQIIFRAIREEQIKERNLSSVKGAFEETMGLQFKDRMEDGIRRVISENPELK